MEEEKYYVKIRDDFGKVRTFEVPTLEMKIAIENIDEEIKQGYKQDALRYSKPFSSFKNMNYIEHHALREQEDYEHSERFMKDRVKIQKSVRKVIKNWTNEKYKKIIYMRFFNGLKFNKIAEILGCSKQSITDNFKTAIQDLSILLSYDKNFQQTRYFKHYVENFIIKTKLTARQMFNDFMATGDITKIIPVDNMINLADALKIEQKKEKKVGVTNKHKQTLKDIKFNLFGEEHNFQEMLDTVSEFLAPFREKA